MCIFSFKNPFFLENELNVLVSVNGQMVYTSKLKDTRVKFYQSITGFIKGKYYRVRFWIRYEDPTVVEMEIPENVECKDLICNIWDNI